MANYESLKAAIQDVVKTNGNNEITGALLQQSLLAMINSLGDGYQYMGVATPTTNPGTPDQNVFYIVSEIGAYSNFGGLSVSDGEVAILKYNGTWTKEVTGAATVAQVTQLGQDIYGSDNIVSPTATSTKYVLRTNGNLASVSSSLSVVSKFDVVGGRKYKISGRVGTTAGTCLYCFFDENDSRISYGVGTTGTVTPYLDIEAIAPANATYIRVAGSTDPTKPYSPNVAEVMTGDIERLDARINAISGERTIIPDLSIAAISYNTGKVTTDFYGKRYWSYIRYIKIGENNHISVKCSSPLYLFVLWYDSSYNYLSYTITQVSTTATSLIPIPNATFFRIRLSNATETQQTTEIPRPILELTGVWGDEWNTACPRPDDGYESLTIPVLLFNPTATDEETDGVQDSGTLLRDYGVMALPEQYSVDGTPTRLIIYCHGAAVNYVIGANRFDATDLDPTYWLSEGYAIMDMEGNPYNNTDEHFGIPQAYQCYKAAYEWVISNYNIRKDGVFLGGRSMGGLMVLDLLSEQRDIPIIAACPNVPCVVPTWYWNYMDATRRGFCSDKMGFTGTTPTWSNTSPMPSAQWQFLQDNFEKMAMASPFWRMLNNLPQKDVLFDGTNINKTSTDNSAEMSVYGGCRLKLKAPVKVFVVKDDATVIYQQNAAILVKVAQQSGQICVARYFEAGGHHYDTQNGELQVAVTNSYGVSITTSVVYVEMLSWWREWENFKV